MNAGMNPTPRSVRSLQQLLDLAGTGGIEPPILELETSVLPSTLRPCDRVFTVLVNVAVLTGIEPVTFA